MGDLEIGRLTHGTAVLVVDDAPGSRIMVAHTLEKGGAIVRTAGSADEALQALEGSLPDVLVSDIGMPGKNGYALIEELRAKPPKGGGKIPAAALTAYTRVEDRVQAMTAGVPNPPAQAGRRHGTRWPPSRLWRNRAGEGAGQMLFQLLPNLLRCPCPDPLPGPPARTPCPDPLPGPLRAIRKTRPWRGRRGSSLARPSRPTPRLDSKGLGAAAGLSV